MKATPEEIDALAKRAGRDGGKVLGVAAGAPVPGLAPGRHEVRIPGFRPPTLNQLMRGRVADRIRLGKMARGAIRAACLAARTPMATRPRRVSMEVTLGPRRRGFDVDAGFKAVLDALVHAGALVDDSARWCELGPVAFARGPEDSTLILLDDLEDWTP